MARPVRGVMPRPRRRPDPPAPPPPAPQAPPALGQTYGAPAPPPDMPASQPAPQNLAKIHRLKSPKVFKIPNPAELGGPDGPSQLVFAPGEVRTNKKGQAVKGKLNNDETLLVATPKHVARVVFQGGEYVHFDHLGYVTRGTLKNDTDLRIRLDEKKVRFKGGNPVDFNRSGYVKWGVLGGDSSLRARGGISGTDMVFKEGTRVNFDPMGLVQSGTLGEDRRLPCVNRDGEPQPSRDFKAGNFVQFDQYGNVILP
jgi:hypothetical protein